MKESSEFLFSTLEGFLPLIEALQQCQPFGTLNGFFNELERSTDSLPFEQKISLINHFPRLVSNERLGENSQQEHRTAGIYDISHIEKSEFEQLNASYFEKFSFPFVICARDFGKTQILAQFELRLARSREEEISESIAQIKRIFWHRLRVLETRVFSSQKEQEE